MNIQTDFVRSLPGDQKELSIKKNYLRLWSIDGPLLILILSISLVGLFVLFSASGRNIDLLFKQAVNFTVAFLAMLVVAQFKVKTIKALTPYSFILGLILLTFVIFFGVDVKGAQRWIDVFGLFRFQPSELMKIVVPLSVAWYLSDKLLPPNTKNIFISFFIVLVPAFFIFLQPDLGTSILIAASGFFVIWLGGIGWRFLITIFGFLILSSWPIWIFLLKSYQKQRILTLFNPEGDKLGAGWNIIQSKTAIGSGGWDGKGWLSGTQSHLDFLPESHTDFVIAVLAEEFGFIGVFLLLLTYFLIIIRATVIAVSANTTYARLVAGSITLTFFIYVIVNMGMVSGMLPVVGIPLPFISYGGTAIVTMMVNFGILMSISTDDSA